MGGLQPSNTRNNNDSLKVVCLYRQNIINRLPNISFGIAYLHLPKINRLYKKKKHLFQTQIQVVVTMSFNKRNNVYILLSQ